MARFSPKARAFIRRPPEHDASVNILSGSVRSGKTWAVVAKLALALNWYPVEGLRIIFGVSKQSVKRNILGPLRDFVGAKAYRYNNASGEVMDHSVPGTCWAPQMQALKTRCKGLLPA